jgi:CRISPR-associated endonuclease/helicase Cas3
MSAADYSAFFRAATGFEPFPFQVALGTNGLPDLLEVPTGFGKTEAVVVAWLWQHVGMKKRDGGHRAPLRLIYCLPMRVLVEQTASRVRSCIERIANQLGAGELPITPDDVHVLMGGAVARGFEVNIDRPCILIGTQDQLLSRALNRGYAMSRYLWPVHFALLNNDCQWVFDEVQLMGVGASTSVQLQQFRASLGVCGPARSLWMSATLESERLNTVDARNRSWQKVSITDSDRASSVLLQRHVAKKSLAVAAVGSHEPKDCAKQILSAHVKNTLTLVVVNRVSRAQDLYSALQRSGSGIEVRLIHGRFRPADRDAIQREALAEGWSGILVATQVVEAGVDISARTLFTDIAPWSAMVQRFGRLNRRGEWSSGEAKAFWMDLPADEDAGLPYDQGDLATSRNKLSQLKDVGPASLASVKGESASAALPFLRKRDLIQLFDTEPDLAGHDLDVSVWIRHSEEADVQVAWRAWDGEAPPDSMREPSRDELCSVAVGSLAKLIKGTKAWRWDGQTSRWQACGQLVPGMTIVVRDQAGGYSAQLGWTGDLKHRPTVLQGFDLAADADDADPFTFRCERFVALEQHAVDAAAELRALSQSGLSVDVPWSELELAARWHDAGKAHEAFQQMLLAPLEAHDARRNGGPWAKSDHASGRNPRRGFRHELASALALLQNGGSDLQAYVVAAHHGKVRLSLRARPGEPRPAGDRLFALGVWDGDVLPPVSLGNGVHVPETALSLDVMRLGDGAQGPSWLERMSSLLEREGPFRLAYLESLVRVADWRATRQYSGVSEVVGADHA